MANFYFKLLYYFFLSMANNNNNNNNNNNFIYIALKSNNCPKRYLITKKNIKKDLNYKISTIYNIIQI